MTQFKVEKEQERLADLTERAEQKAQEAASLEKKIEKIQKKQVAVQAVDRLSNSERSSMTLEDSGTGFGSILSTAAKKYVVQEKKEHRLQKMLDAANKAIAELKAKISELTAELTEYRSIRRKLHPDGLEVENEQLRSKICSYETTIERNNLWHLFSPKRSKNHSRNDVR